MFKINLLAHMHYLSLISQQCLQAQFVKLTNLFKIQVYVLKY